MKGIGLLAAGAIVAVLALGQIGCATVGEQVVPMANRDAAALTAEQTVDVMRQAGFTHEQIVEHGPRLRNTLASAGAAQVRVNGVVQALFAVDGDRLYVSARGRAAFITPLGESD